MTDAGWTVLSDVHVALADDAVERRANDRSPTSFCASSAAPGPPSLDHCVVWHCEVVRSNSACGIAPVSPGRLHALALALRLLHLRLRELRLRVPACSPGAPRRVASKDGEAYRPSSPF